MIADYYLPGFTALDAWQALQQQAQARDTPFILLSGAIGETAAVEAIQQGLADYVLKDAIVRLPHVFGPRAPGDGRNAPGQSPGTARFRSISRTAGRINRAFTVIY